MASHSKLIPLIVAAPMFLQNIDLMAASVALPHMAASLHVEPLHLNLVIAAYAISLAVFLPLSAWLVDRFGAKRMFCIAIMIFASASALCGLAISATMLIGFRVMQGFGAALMVPVGRLILLRSVPASDMVRAMVWFTIPPAIGRLTGPLIGGAIVSIASWRWIFLINIPLGLIALALALVFLKEPDETRVPDPFDLRGFLLMGLGLGATLGGLEMLGRGLVDSWICYAAIGLGMLLLGLYGWHSLRLPTPVIDLRILRYRTFRTNIIGALPLRLANSSAPFLVPLMLQLGMGFAPLQAGFLASGVAVGSLATRLVMRRVMTLVSFRTLFLFANFFTAVALGCYGLLSPDLPRWAIFGTFCLGGLVTSLCLVSLNTIGFIDVPDDRRGHATALVAMAQQSNSAMAVVLSAALLSAFSAWHGGDRVNLAQADFSATFLVMALLAAVSLVPFSRLHPDEGHELR